MQFIQPKVQKSMRTTFPLNSRMERISEELIQFFSPVNSGAGNIFGRSFPRSGLSCAQVQFEKNIPARKIAMKEKCLMGFMMKASWNNWWTSLKKIRLQMGRVFLLNLTCRSSHFIFFWWILESMGNTTIFQGDKKLGKIRWGGRIRVRGRRFLLDLPPALMG